MSEYQFYEFLALDRPLTDQQMKQLRTVSSRAQITPTRFANEYDYGDFRGNKAEFMSQYFDVMIYVANWGTHQLMLRLPADLIDPQALQACCSGDSASIQKLGDCIVLDLCSRLEEYMDWEEGEVWMAPLAPLRNELLQGDMRLPYLGWLLCVQNGEFDDQDTEPFIPPGLQNLSAPLETLCEFLRIDLNLLAVAAERSTPLTGLISAGIEEWVATLPEDEKNRLLLEVIGGKDPQLGTRLLHRYRVDSADQPSVAQGDFQGRRVDELLDAVDRHREQREREEARQAAEARARHEAKQAAKRTKYLDTLAPRQDEIWRVVDGLVALKKAKTYDQATKLLKDLRDIGERENTTEQFQTRLRDLHQSHQNKRAFIQRLQEAKLL